MSTHAHTTNATPEIAASPLQAGAWQVDHQASQVRFATRKMGFYLVRGRFARFLGKLQAAEPGERNGAPVRAELRIAAQSITTGIAARDRHLQGKAFLDVASYPEITFTAARVTSDAETQGALRIQGPLTIHGETAAVDLLAHVHSHDDDTLHLIAVTALDRYRFGVKAWYPLEWMLGRNVRAELDLVLRRV